METKLYIFAAWGCVEPEMIGPYKTERGRIAAAKRYKRKNGEDSAVFRLDVTNGVPTAGSFINDELD
jgi:hypothetical protein